MKDFQFCDSFLVVDKLKHCVLLPVFRRGIHLEPMQLLLDMELHPEQRDIGQQIDEGDYRVVGDHDPRDGDNGHDLKDDASQRRERAVNVVKLDFRRSRIGVVGFALLEALRGNLHRFPVEIVLEFDVAGKNVVLTVIYGRAVHNGRNQIDAQRQRNQENQPRQKRQVLRHDRIDRELHDIRDRKGG